LPVLYKDGSGSDVSHFLNRFAQAWIQSAKAVAVYPKDGGRSLVSPAGETVPKECRAWSLYGRPGWEARERGVVRLPPQPDNPIA
jgi:hypothetical protein